eukprot:COSAG01_NODE_172_length_23108_cov_26.690496_5_plen_103_part_00
MLSYPSHTPAPHQLALVVGCLCLPSAYACLSVRVADGDGCRRAPSPYPLFPPTSHRPLMTSAATAAGAYLIAQRVLLPPPEDGGEVAPPPWAAPLHRCAAPC